MWFNQPAQKRKRRQLREIKAKKQFPMPLEKLAPVIRQPTQRHNHKIRLGRGFTEEEIKKAGLEFKYALAIGIKYDKRRKDRNMETFDRNVNRIKDYVANVKVYKNRREAKADNASSYKGIIFPVKNERPKTQFINISELDRFAQQFTA